MNTATHTGTIDKLPTTNSNTYRAAVRRYLADATEVEHKPNASEDERIAHMIERFEAEYGWNIDRQGPHRAAKEWLQGLAINIEYMDAEIPGVVLGLHGLSGQMSPRLERAVVQGYWEHMAAQVCRLRNEARRKVAGFRGARPKQE